MGLPLFTLAADDPAAHVYNHVFAKMNDQGKILLPGDAGFEAPGQWWVFSANQGNLILTMLILVVVGLYVASRVRTGPESLGTGRYVARGKFAHMVEVICVYLREEVARPLLGDRTDKLMPFLWTIFFFILVNNLLGLLPIMDLLHLVFPRWAEAHATPLGGTATQNFFVTGVLAVFAGLFFNLVAIGRLGLGGYLKHMTAGAPFPVSVLIFFLELISQIVIKPFALAMRLFANMTAGHILLATLLGFVAMVAGSPFYIKGPVTVISVLGAFGIMLLELFVAFMQAFVFMFLTTVFIALMDHDEHHADGHEHEQGHDHGHAPALGHEHA
jgi:F-type H+-transporting ATPase subunit a